MKSGSVSSIPLSAMPMPKAKCIDPFSSFFSKVKSAWPKIDQKKAAILFALAWLVMFVPWLGFGAFGWWFWNEVKDKS